MAKPKNINLFLLDGTADGRIKCTISNGVEIIFKIPRKDLAKCNERDELKHGGIYFLLGERDELKLTCVGQAAKNLFEQLNEHDRETDKNFWTEAIVFTTTNNSFGEPELLWLENKFCDLAKSTERIIVKIGNDSALENTTVEETNRLESYSEFAQQALDKLNTGNLESLPVETSAEEIFYLSHFVKKFGRTVNAQMKRTPKGYSVLAGSEISPVNTRTLSEQIQKQRRSAKFDANGNLLETVEFSSSSDAAAFVIGDKVDGSSEWKTRDGVTLKNFLQGDNLFGD